MHDGLDQALAARLANLDQRFRHIIQALGEHGVAGTRERDDASTGKGLHHVGACNWRQPHKPVVTPPRVAAAIQTSWRLTC